LFTAKTFGHLSDRPKKTLIDIVLTQEHYTGNKVFVSGEGINTFQLCQSRRPTLPSKIPTRP